MKVSKDALFLHRGRDAQRRCRMHWKITGTGKHVHTAASGGFKGLAARTTHRATVTAGDRFSVIRRMELIWENPSPSVTRLVLVGARARAASQVSQCGETVTGEGIATSDFAP